MQDICELKQDYTFPTTGIVVPKGTRVTRHNEASKITNHAGGTLSMCEYDTPNGGRGLELFPDKLLVRLA